MRNLKNLAAALALALLSTPMFAVDLIPTTGTDIGAFITEGITKMAVVAGVAIGGYFAFKILVKGLKWVNKAL